METIEQIQLCYEIALSIGTSLDEEAMLKRCLSTVLKKLNCSGGMVFREQDGERRVAIALPRRLKESETLGTGAYRFTLPGYGTLALVKHGAPLPADLIRSLEVIFLKLAQAGLACAANERLQRAHDEAIAASRAKSDFLANMSHEIRTPLGAIMGMTDLALDADRVTDKDSYLKIVRGSSDLLLGLVSDILDFSRIEAGHLDLEHRPFRLHEIVAETIAIMSNAAAEKGLTLELFPGALPDGHPGAFIGDGSRIRQILLNLIGNAIKFTDRGGVQVAVTRVERAFSLRTGKHDRITIEVRDTGIGIPAGALERIFEKFSQADTSSSRHFGGTGLGLSICRSLVERMNGRIEVESTYGAGSVFRFNLMLTPADELQAEFEAATEERPVDLHGTRILIVDDDIHNRRVLKEHLRKLGCEAAEAASGRECLRAACASRFDLIFMDIQMPGLDGFATTRRLRALERRAKRPEIPIVALTAHAISGYETICMEAGMQDYLTKPLHADRLARVLRRHAPAVATQY